ncbi:hypothetical protein RSAG8_05248, partial [Rhizoctonia solani AG-8 WAC10335]
MTMLVKAAYTSQYWVLIMGKIRIRRKYSLGLPYPQCQKDIQILMLLQRGVFPERPNEILKDDARGNQIWDLLVSCWNHETGARPSAIAVLEAVCSLVRLKEQGAPELLFPAKLVSLVSKEMWKYGMMKESERFLANTMQTIQAHVMVSSREW